MYCTYYRAHILNTYPFVCSDSQDTMMNSGTPASLGCNSMFQAVRRSQRRGGAVAAEGSGKEGRGIWNLLSSQWLVVWDYARLLVLPEPCLQIRPPVSDTTTKDAQDNRSGIYRARQLVTCTTTTTRIPLLLAAFSAASTLLRLKSTGITRNFVSHVVSTERHRSPIPEPRPSFQRPTRRLPALPEKFCAKVLAPVLDSKGRRHP